MRYKANQFEKEEEIYKASEMLEEKYGRGHVVIKDDFSSTGRYLLCLLIITF